MTGMSSEPRWKLRGENRMKGLADPRAEQGWGTPCLVCGAWCADPGGRLYVMCGDCAQRMGNAITRRYREEGRGERR